MFDNFRRAPYRTRHGWTGKFIVIAISFLAMIVRYRNLFRDIYEKISYKEIPKP